MNADEALKVLRLAKALSPAQSVDEFTPDAWALVLRHVRLTDALEALELLGAEQEWIHVSHIVARVKRIRRERVSAYGTLPDPPSNLDPSDTAAYTQWLKTTTRAIADGEQPDLPAELTTRRNVAALGHVGLAVDKPYTKHCRDVFHAAKGATIRAAVKAPGREDDA